MEVVYVLIMSCIINSSITDYITVYSTADKCIENKSKASNIASKRCQTFKVECMKAKVK